MLRDATSHVLNAEANKPSELTAKCSNLSRHVKEPILRLKSRRLSYRSIHPSLIGTLTLLLQISLGVVENTYKILLKCITFSFSLVNKLQHLLFLNLNFL